MIDKLFLGILILIMAILIVWFAERILIKKDRKGMDNTVKNGEKSRLQIEKAKGYGSIGRR